MHNYIVLCQDSSAHRNYMFVMVTLEQSLLLITVLQWIYLCHNGINLMEKSVCSSFIELYLD